MKSIVFSALCTAALITPTSALADLGAADSGERRELSGYKHKAWCGTKANTDCIVEFDQERMKVDGGKGITTSQLKAVLRDEKMHKGVRSLARGASCGQYNNTVSPGHCQVFFEFNYTDDDGQERWATIRFVNRVAAISFKSDVEAWFGQPLRTVGPSVKLEL